MGRVFLSTKSILFVPVLFIVITIFNIGIEYYGSKARMYDFIKNQAQNLNVFITAYRKYYQKLYIDKAIPLNEKTISGLPAYSAYDISENFSEKNSFGISVQTVSNRARNIKNQANQSELVAIKFFEKNTLEKDYFRDEGDFFQYATPLYIEKKCLFCHGKKEDAPKFISEKYTNAYNYEIGDLRGIVSIKVPKAKISSYFNTALIRNIIIHLIMAFIVFLVATYLIRYFRGLSSKLENEIKYKTKELESSLAFLESYKIAMDENQIVSKSDLKGNIKYVNKNFENLTGYTQEEVIGKPHSLLKHVDTDKETFQQLWKTITAGKVWKGILKNKKKNGSYYWIDTAIVPIKDEAGKNREYISLRHDITELVEQREQLEKVAHTDALTGLGSRHKLVYDILQSKQPSLAILNIDQFSLRNDFYGQEVGDIIIIEVGRIIKELLEEEKGCGLYHLQGDEYVILNDGLEKEVFIEKIKMLLSEISQTPIRTEVEKLYLSLSTAISFERDSLLSTANMALKIAKRDKKDLVVYDKNISLVKEYENNIKWAKKLKYAIEEDTIVPFFQPIVNNKTGKWEKYESLVRIVDNENIITPYHFLDISKKTKHYAQITKIVLDKTFEFFKDKDTEFSINLTIEDITNEDIKQYIFSTLEKYKIGSRAVFEIVESESIENFDLISKFIKDVKEYGCKVAIDDFGTGYSNFEYLLKLKADYLKIDGSLIKNINQDKDTFLVVETIVSFAKKIGMKTIAEFVENEEVERVVKELGIDYSQGYYYSEPKPTIED